MALFVAAEGYDYSFNDFPEPWARALYNTSIRIDLYDAPGPCWVGVDHPWFAKVVDLGPHPKWQGVQCLRIDGTFPGKTVLRAKQTNRSGMEFAKADLDLFGPAKVKINFFRVHNWFRETPVFALASAANWVKKLNAIYTPQTGIQFALNLVEEVRLWKDVTTPGGAASDRKERILDRLAKIASRHSAGPSDLNVFWMKKWDATEENIPNRPRIGGEAITSGNLCIVEDLAYPEMELKNLGHELGHCLGARHTFGEPESLMYYSLENMTGYRIWRMDANAMRARVAKKA